MFEAFFNVTLKEYLINFLIYGQTIFFMWLFEKSFKKTFKHYEYEMITISFYTIAYIFSMIIIITGFSFNYYKTHLIIQYVILVLISFHVLCKKYNSLTAISLSFLLVFLNSYYWEIVLHLTEYNTNPLTIFNFRETYHLIVLPFLLTHYYFDKHVVLKKLAIGICISYLSALINFEVIPYFNLQSINIPFFNSLVVIIYFINKTICLMILLNIISNDVIKKRKRKDWFI